MQSHPHHHQQTKELISSILTSPRLGDIWARHHKSKADNNPALDIAEQVQNISQNLEDYPEMLLFMRSLIEIELKAIKKPKNDRDTAFEKYLEHLHSYTDKLCTDQNISLDNTKLPKEYHSILDMLEYQTGKTPIRPLHSLWKITKASANHIAEDAKEHPFLFSSLVSVAAGMVYLSTLNIKNTATIYMEESTKEIADLGDDFWSDDISGDFTDDSFLFDPNLAEAINIPPSCHETTIEMGRLLAGDMGAQLAKAMPNWITTIFPEHCTKVKTLANDAIGGLQGGFGWIHERLDVVIRDPANNLGNKLLENSVFQESFINAANNTADFWYRFNDIENIAVHTLLTGITAAAVVKYDSLSTEESKEWKNEVSDFFYRTTHNLPLSYILACGGSSYAYFANEGLSPNIIWYGLSGVIAGNTIHKLYRGNKNTALSLSINKSIAEISDAIKILSAEITGEVKHYQHRSWKDYLKTPAVIATTATGLTAIDTAITGGAVSGSIAGGATVSAQYLMYNVVEDTALHGVFITLGIAIGKSISYSAKAYEYLKNLASNDHS